MNFSNNDAFFEEEFQQKNDDFYQNYWDNGLEKNKFENDDLSLFEMKKNETPLNEDLKEFIIFISEKNKSNLQIYFL